MTGTTAQDIYKTSLQNTRTLEQQGLQQMESQLAGLDKYPRYKAALQAHVSTTKPQISRLDRALQDVGSSPSTLKETVASIAGSIGAAVHATSSDETLKNLYAGYAFQFDQIAAYTSLIVIAKAAGQSSRIAEFESTIEEERSAAKTIEGLIEPVTSEYLALETTGQKADS